jgi:hypothetical protein
MAHIRSCFLSAVAGLICLGSSATQIRKFYPDDPIQVMPKPVPVREVKKRKIFAPYDYLHQTTRQKMRASGPAMGINTLGEVPDCAWFTNRHGRNRMTLDELKRGPGNENAPKPPYVIVGAKTEGNMPGFRMRDANGRLYFVKSDPITNPEMATAADVLGSKFFYAIGYYTPENYIVRIRKSDLAIDKTAETKGPDGISRKMVPNDISDILAKMPVSRDGSFRIMASLQIPGKDLGPFRYEGTRSDDPNDIIPHENRRELRGLYVFCAWLNHTDAKADNSFNALVKVDEVTFIRHYLLDFGSAFGSNGDAKKDARFGNEYQIPTAGRAFESLLGLSFYSPKWERAEYPKLRGVGRIESKVFDPERWKPNYPNPAFLNRRLDDEYWASKIVLAFTDDDIRALVETGEYSDLRVVRYLVNTLAQRRDKIGRTYFSKVLPLDSFRVSDGELIFEDLAVQYKFRAPFEYSVSWSLFDNSSGTLTPLPEETAFHLPSRFSSFAEGDYFAARIHSPMAGQKTVTVYLRKKGPTAEVVGLERSW